MNRFIVLFFVMLSMFAGAQSKFGQIVGQITDESGQTLLGVTVLLNNTSQGAATDLDGNYVLNRVRYGNYSLKISAIGYQTQEIDVAVNSEEDIVKNFVLKEDTSELDQVYVVGKTKAEKIKEVGFSVNAIETQKIKTQSIAINTVLDNSVGVRVRTTGGVGSDFEYSLNGMSGNAIRFFIDGIPMDYFGSSYSVNNLPIALIDRIDIFKGVVPVELGSDALGGAINLVTKEQVENFAEVSYSFGSFNTHKVAFNGQWKFDSGFTTRLSSFYTYSDNNYNVWGRGVYYGEEDTGKAIEFTKDNPAERFNDDFQTFSTKLDVGFTNKSWADQLFLSILGSDLKKGVQTGQTMGHVYGEMRNNEQVLMPSLTYKKKDIFTKGLDVSTFAAYSHTKAEVIDTTTARYDWRGEVIGTNPSGGETSRNGRSLYTQTDNSVIARFNGTYQLPKDFKLGFNYLYTSTSRTGEDPFSPPHRLAYFDPQNIASHFAGLSLETIKFNNRLRANAFVKWYGFDSSINEVVYTTEYEVRPVTSNISNWGGGFAMSYKLFQRFLLKSSLEQATRLPNATEALGNGVTITNNPDIKPEQSFNANVGFILGRLPLGGSQGIKLEMNAFYRNTTDKLQMNVQGGQATGIFENIKEVSGTGVELDVVYDLNQKFKFNINGTYLDFRNTLKVDENGNDNIIYGDRLKNEPYLMANAGVEYTLEDVIQKKSKLFMYLQSSYVHDFFLNWSSLGNEDTKNKIPTQLVFDAGLGYTFPNEKLNVSVDFSNFLNEQVYDNFLLQKPGRAIFLKLNYQFL
ncbi:TonB-dependent receptor [Tamlana sp. 2_MG-2023]|uniref:TonB-dependent receptor n=1 Tax=unclassified Tamlana TaxID=2614803 RepID=UPI0026E43990|nr:MULTISPECIES: carboxypeptidase-like regulatory domain-containing protein [unclassified Tamlana]MDO6761164.1 TonB-dependent receptor [Tamlana sp. 2_MG-2023]MDO6791503.1 TonB-dependent receptor [Tamlana sp. 1_MG-2023]